MAMVFRYLFIINLFLAQSLMAKDLIIMGNEEDNSLPVTALRIVLERANIKYTHYDQEVTVNKLLADLNNGDLDVIWQMTSSNWEEDYTAIYFPVYRGTLGMRLGITKRENSSIFKNVKNINDLRQFKAGQGKGWADTMILEANKLTVVQSHKYENLFHMLEGERFDYFPRGLFEPWGEVERFGDLNLVVEPNIMIHYVAPMYYFVRKGENQLAQTIFTELNKMAESGEYQSLFYSDENVKNSLQLSNLQNRTVIKLDNPHLSARAPLDKKHFWFNPTERK